tara:strand:- start:3652 stop:4587 length:936 start_codon:yes stop_codon:yes gene_type:complete
MLISRCATRISLAGGSTDLQSFIDHNGYGSVISFPCNIYTYITLFKDKYGYNKLNTYLLNYTRREEVTDIKGIHNDVAREVLDYFKCEPITLNFHSDVFSSGSGLASSSSYLVNCIRAVSENLGVNLSVMDICGIALNLERKFNALTGYQDVYGCAIDGFKQLSFHKGGKVSINKFKKSFLNNFKMYLRPTLIKRSSTEVLKTINLQKVGELLPFVEKMKESIISENKESFTSLIKESWEAKKKTSPLILENRKLVEIEDNLQKDPSVLAHRLCGAGNGGFFLIFRGADYNEETKDIPISVAPYAHTYYTY